MVGLHRLRHIPAAPWMEGFWWEAGAKLPDCTSQQAVTLLLSAVGLGQAPPREWRAAWYSRTAQLMQASARGDRSFCSRVWGSLSLVCVGVRVSASPLARTPPHPALAHRHALPACSTPLSLYSPPSPPPPLHPLLQAGDMTIQGCSMALAALAALERRPPTPWLDLLLTHSAQPAIMGALTQPLGAEKLLWALAKLRVVPPGAWLAAYWAAAEPLVGRFGAFNCSEVCWAAASLGVRPPDSFLAALAARAGALEAEGAFGRVSRQRLKWGLGRLLPAQRLPPPPGGSSSSSSRLQLLPD